MREKIWYFWVDARFHSEYLALYIRRLNRIRTVHKLMSLAISTLGIFGWIRFAEYGPVWAIIMTAVTIAQRLEDYYLPAQAEIASLGKAMQFYVSAATRMEELWHNLQGDRREAATVSKRYFELKAAEESMIKTQNHQKVREIKSYLAHADMVSKAYFSRFITVQENG